MKTSRIFTSLSGLILALLLISACMPVQPPMPDTQPDAPSVALPDDIRAIMDKPLYENATWSLRVLDTQSGEVVYDLNSHELMLVGSLRKLFSVGVTLDQLGTDHQFVTQVYSTGPLDADGTLQGDLVLVASGDVTMGMRRQPDGTMAISRIDHNEAIVVGNSVLTDTDARAAYRQLAEAIAASGVTAISGEIIVDDRLFEPFDFRGQYDVQAAVVNENFVDVAAVPGAAGEAAQMDVRPDSAAFTVDNLTTSVAGDGLAEIEVDPFIPDCIGTPGCGGTVTGELPIDGGPAVTNEYPIVQNFRIAQPSNFVRTVFIEELQKAGVDVAADVVAPNPSEQLPDASVYTPEMELAAYTSLHYSEYARLILKVSFNLGADVSLIQFGLSQGVDNLDDSLAAERERLTTAFDIPDGDFYFVDGSGGGETTATSYAITTMLQQMASRPTFEAYKVGLPLLGEDGTLGIVTEFQNDPTLTGATGQVMAKTGTYGTGTPDGLIALKARAMAGYIHTQSGRDLTFVLNVNDAGVFEEFLDTVEVNEDLGTITAMLWRDN